MIYDGKNIIIDTQENNDPHKIITIKTLKRTNPLGAKLIKTFLKNRIPKSLKRCYRSNLTLPSIQPVIPNKHDLGLINSPDIFKKRYEDDVNNINEYNK